MFAAKNKNNNQPVPHVKDQVLTMDRAFLHRKTWHSTDIAVPNLAGSAESVFTHKTLYSTAAK